MTTRSASPPGPFLEQPRILGLLGDEARIRRRWQGAFFATLAVLGISALALAHIATQTRVESVVVLVNELGEAELVGAVSKLSDDQRERVTRSQLALLIRNLRSVYADPGAQAELLRRAYALLSPEAAEALNVHFASPENDPRALGRTISREVRVRSVGLIPGTDSWRVQWTETEVPNGAGSPRSTAWEAYIAVREYTPASVGELELNPLGLQVTALNWTPVTQDPR